MPTTIAHGLARAALARDSDPFRALDAALAQLLAAPGADAGGQAHSAGPTPAAGVDAALLFASATYADELPRLVPEARARTGARLLIGCSGQGVIGLGREVEDEPALSLLTFSMPGAGLRACRFTQDQLEEAPQQSDGDLDPDQALARAEWWYRETGVPPEQVRAWLLFADPFRLDCEGLVGALSQAYPQLAIVGGLASGDSTTTYVFLDDRVYDSGAVGLAVGGGWTVRAIVSQGAMPIGDPWTITGVHGPFIETIGRRPAYEVLVDTISALSPELQARAQRHLLVGLAMDERRETLGRGDYLIRNLMGVDQRTGALAVGAHPRLGQTIQFQLRDAGAADEELRTLLAGVAPELARRPAAGAILCACNGRGRGLFGAPDHDAGLVTEQLGALPLAGFFCNGEIGPVASRTFIHGFTASLALLVPVDELVGGR